MFFRGSLLFRFTFRREFAIIVSTLKRYAPVAQLDRVTDSDSVGRTFESCRAYHKNTHPTGVGIFIARYGSKFMPRRGKSCRAYHRNPHPQPGWAFLLPGTMRSLSPGGRKRVECTKNDAKSYDFTSFLYDNVLIPYFCCIAQPDRAFRKIAQISKLLCIIWLAAFLFLSNAWV